MTLRRIAATAALLALAAGVASPAGAYDKKGERVARGLEIAPVPLDLKGKDENLVGLGSYLVNGVGGCNDCHTAPPYAPGGDPFAGEKTKINAAGYLAGGTPFGPGLFSANLTPDAKGLPGGMTYKQFKRAIRYGQDPEDPKRLLQVMPWPVYRNLTDHDLHAIYVYLTAIPSIVTEEAPAPAKKG